MPYESVVNIYWGYESDPLVVIGCNAELSPGVGTNNFSVSGNIELEFNRELNEEVTNGIYSMWGNPAWFYDQFYTSVSYTVTFSGNKLIIDPDTDLSADTYYQLGVAVCGESMSDLYYTGWYYPGYISFKTAP
ncbi:MAG: Ig-like domain-containing protein [Chloroflexia bacterium]|nr:Ig-like domain-containing protein [Chloroflexia bacterium]